MEDVLLMDRQMCGEIGQQWHQFWGSWKDVFVFLEVQVNFVVKAVVTELRLAPYLKILLDSVRARDCLKVSGRKHNIPVNFLSLCLEFACVGFLFFLFIHTSSSFFILVELLILTISSHDDFQSLILLYIEKKKVPFQFQTCCLSASLNISSFIYYKPWRKADFECLVYTTCYFADNCYAPSSLPVQPVKIIAFSVQCVGVALLNSFSMAFSKPSLFSGIFYSNSYLH